MTRIAQTFDNPPRLPVERFGRSRPDIENHNANRGRVDQGFQVGLGPLFLPVQAGVGDHKSRLGGEHDQGILVFPGERPAGFLSAQEEVAGPLAPMEDRRGKKGEDRACRQGKLRLRQAPRPEVAEQVGEPEGGGKVSEILVEPHPLGHAKDPPFFFGRNPRREKFPGTTRIVEEGHHPVASSRQRPGRVQDPLHHRVEIQAVVDAQAGLAQLGQAPTQSLYLRIASGGSFRCHLILTNHFPCSVSC